ncbi:hypothetical protein LOK49_LG09G00552 [Camellia lanceoleosa]|uniref:Uncharacterized protein n=1 Tax=Camellia lanceoleosa TaxID=1840588 RepID=A0ACC0GFS7_9ERIC|nr:hypothetical protein LOK49_LG09G00552 [Camellia lanceoleosa]
MEDWTTKYLLQKLNGLVNEIEAGEQPLLVKVADLSSKFEELKKSLEQQSTSTAEASNASALSEDKLYELHNFLMMRQRQRQIQIQSDKKMTTAIEYASFYNFAAGVNIIIGQLRQERGQTNQANWCEWETEAFWYSNGRRNQGSWAP